MTDRPIFIVEPDAGIRGDLAAQLPAARAMSGMADLLEVLRGPAVAVLGPSFASPDALEQVASVLTSRPALGSVLIANELTTEVLQASMRAGVKDVLSAPTPLQMADSIDRVADALPGSTLPGLPVPTAEAGPRGRLITVFSTKGGSGKTMLATNLAVTLARRQSEPVVLVDADLQFGDVAVMLKLAPKHTIVDAVTNIDRLDAGFLQNLLIMHEDSGLYVLPAPLEPAFAEQIGAREVTTIVDLLLQFGAYVVVDTPAYFNEVVLSLIEESDDLLLMAGMDIPNIKNVKIGLQTLRLLNTPMSKVRLVLNRSNSKVKLDVSEVERSLQGKAECQIPSDVVVPQSVNKGVPVVMDAPKSGPAKAIEGLVKMLISENTR